MTLTATSRIEGIAILQHHDLVTAEAIVDANVLEQRHRAPRRSARRRTEQDELLRTQPPEVARTEPNADRERGGTQADVRPQQAHTAQRRPCR